MIVMVAMIVMVVVVVQCSFFFLVRAVLMRVVLAGQ